MTGVPSYQPPVSAGGVGGVAPPAAVNKAPPRKRGGISIINPNTGKSIFDQSSNDKEATGKEDQDAAEVLSRPIEMRILHRNERCSKACSAHFAPAAYFTAATLFFLPFCE